MRIMEMMEKFTPEAAPSGTGSRARTPEGSLRTAGKGAILAMEAVEHTRQSSVLATQRSGN